VQKWGLIDCAVFQIQIRSKFITIAADVLNWPKLPNIPGILDLQGDMFHSAHWAYNATGGSSRDPSLVKLKNKQVVIMVPERRQCKSFHSSHNGRIQGLA